MNDILIKLFEELGINARDNKDGSFYVDMPVSDIGANRVLYYRLRSLFFEAYIPHNSDSDAACWNIAFINVDGSALISSVIVFVHYQD